MIDLSKYRIILDVWESTGDIDEATLKANGVDGLIIRMNPSWGGLQYDNNFLRQWKQAEGFKRAAYVVVSPLNIGHRFTSKEVADWILAWKPVDCNIIALDVEIDAATIYDDPTITPAVYSRFLSGIYQGLRQAGITMIQYSGTWFFNNVSPWIKNNDINQWFARYLDAIEPEVQKDFAGHLIFPQITWRELKEKISALDWSPLVDGFTEAMTGRIVIWQMTSVFVLPGCQPNQPVDVNIMTREDFARIFGEIETREMKPSEPSLTLENHDQRLRAVESALAALTSTPES